MKASELRIGNLVYDEEIKSVMIVSRIESKEYTEWNSNDEYNIVCKQLNTNTYYEGNFKPIELTEEWLLKFGFTKDRNGYRLSDINSLSFSENLVACWHDKVLGIKQIKYVHQLQNLYFCLTGEELKINE